MPIRMDVELRPISFENGVSQTGSPIHALISNVGPGGVMVDLATEHPIGARFWVRTRVNGRRVEFYAIVRHISTAISAKTTVYAHGLQITAALADVMDEFNVLMSRYVKGELKRATEMESSASAPLDKQSEEDRDGATLAN
ncbi:MAG: hypothetical protein P4L33_09395 [Capsulimonadaceae bacterium]|nr:hypothetical protein [Capsulimonadaceae bacterium]